MKKKLSPFVAGMVTMAIVSSLGVSALAASGAFTITVNPINIQVNGQTFQPKDAQGNDVPVFSLDGTTYAPLRALAEAYGLEVGYDPEANMATVGAKAAEETSTPSPDYSNWTEEEEKAYQEFKAMWEYPVSQNDPGWITVTCEPQLAIKCLELWNALTLETKQAYVVRFIKNFRETASAPSGAVWFRVGENQIGGGTWLGETSIQLIIDGVVY